MSVSVFAVRIRSEASALFEALFEALFDALLNPYAFDTRNVWHLSRKLAVKRWKHRDFRCVADD
jgi:hypothetical protein